MSFEPQQHQASMRSNNLLPFHEPVNVETMDQYGAQGRVGTSPIASRVSHRFIGQTTTDILMREQRVYDNYDMYMPSMVSMQPYGASHHYPSMPRYQDSYGQYGYADYGPETRSQRQPLQIRK